MPVVPDELRQALEQMQRHPSVRVVAGGAQVDISQYVESIRISLATAERAGSATLVLTPGSLFDPLNLNAPYADLLREDTVVRIYKSEQGKEYPWFYGLVTKGEAIERRGRDDRLTLTLLDRSKNFSRIKVTTGLYQQTQANQIIRELFMANGLAENEISLTTLDYEIWEVQFVDETLMDIARMCLAPKRYAVFFDAEGKLVSVPPADAEITPDVYQWIEDSKEEFEQGTRTGNAIVTEDGKLELDWPSKHTDFSEYPTDQQPHDWTWRRKGSGDTLLVREKAGTSGGKCLELKSSTVSVRRLVSWDTPGQLWDVEVLTLFRAQLENAGSGITVLRLVPAPSSTWSWAEIEQRYTEVYLRVYVSNTEKRAASCARTLLKDLWYWVRFQAVGNRYRMRFWQDGQPEPDSWDIDVEDTWLTAPGWVGIAHYGTSSLGDWDDYEVRGTISSGTRISPEFNISSVGRAQASRISWSAAVPTGCTLEVETRLSFDQGLSWTDWTEVANGGAIPGIAKGTDLANARLQTRVSMTSSVSGTTPSVSSISVEITSYPSVSGQLSWQYDGRHVEVLSSEWGDARTPNTVVVYGRTKELFEPTLEEQKVASLSGTTGLWQPWKTVTYYYQDSQGKPYKAVEPRIVGQGALPDGWESVGYVTKAKIVSRDPNNTWVKVVIYNSQATWNVGEYWFDIWAKPLGQAVPGVIMATARNDAEVARDGGEILEEIDEIPVFTQEDAQALADATLQLHTWLRRTMKVQVLGNMTHSVGELVQVYNPRTDCTVTLYVYEVEHDFKRGSHDVTVLSCAVMNVEEG